MHGAEIKRNHCGRIGPSLRVAMLSLGVSVVTSRLRSSSLSRGFECNGLFTIVTVAVGTIITDRPPHRSVRARLRIRLLRRMSGVEACIGIGVQNAGWGNPPVQDWGETFPPHLCALTPADQNTLP